MAAAAPYSFGTAGYHRLFGGVPEADTAALRKATIEYVKGFNKQSWYDDPVVTILNGVPLKGGSLGKTVDWAGKENGAQITATEAEVDMLIHHAHTFQPRTDYRAGIHKIDERIMNLPLAAHIIGNQAMDFGKQDGITEVEEAGQANKVEQRLNDALLEDENRGRVVIIRKPAFIGCVSNFSNFLDLSRKVMRNMELGVPVIVLSRSNTTQHMFRWTQMLLKLMAEYDVDPGLLTYAAMNRKQKNRMFAACPDSPSYFTCSREVAADLVKQLPKTMSSTGGPNTMIAAELNEKTGAAFVMSNLIENSGQCTALRHGVFPNCTPADLEKLYAPTPHIKHVSESLESGSFSALYASGENDRKDGEGYKRLSSQPMVAYKINKEYPYGIEEGWREPVVDITTSGLSSKAERRALARWLNTEQPISLAMNVDWDVAREIFETTSLVVYTAGTPDKPALTCQARPQDGECFGEFPPRHQLKTYTHLPVIIPSSTPGYNCVYTEHYLKEKATGALPAGLEWASVLLEGLSPHVKGFGIVILEYLADGCGPKIGFGNRTALFGIQRPPLLEESPSVLRIDTGVTSDTVLPTVLPFLVSNARTGLELSFGPGHNADTFAAALAKLNFPDLKIVHEDTKAFEHRVTTFTPYNVIRLDAGKTGWNSLEPILVAHWVSRVFPMGHIKSVNKEDEAFIGKFFRSQKWLRIEKRPLSAL